MQSPLYPEELRAGIHTRRIGKRVHYFAEIDSTNLWAQRRAAQGGEEGEMVIAETQTQGKGRLGRRWVSPPGLNLYLSVILRPQFPPVHAPQITLMSAVAVAETVRSFIPFAPQIKWPNDILVQGKKLAGILTESSCDPERIHFVILGIGVNLNFPRDLMPESIRDRSTSILDLTGKPVDRMSFARRLIQDLDRCYGDLEEEGFPSMARRWEGFFYLRGRRVRVESMDHAVLGRAMGIDRDGALIIEGEGGALQRIVAGDVVPVEQ